MALYTYLFFIGVIMVLIGILTDLFDLFGKLNDVLGPGAIILWIVAVIWRNFSKFPPLTLDYFFENSPPFSITSNHSYTETRYWVYVLD